MNQAISWRTSTGGIAASVGILVAFVLPKLGWEVGNGEAQQVAGAIVTIGGLVYQAWCSRDDRVSSEGKKIVKTTTGRRVAPLVLLAMVAGVAMPACTAQRVGGVVAAKGAEYRSEGSARNTLLVNSDGSTVQDYAAEPGAAVIASQTGVENYGSVAFGTVHIDLPDGTRLLATVPNDFAADSVSINHADGESVVVSGISISTSDVIVARSQIIVAMSPIIQSWTKEQKEAMLAQYEAQVAAGDMFAQTIVPLIRASLGAP